MALSTDQGKASEALDGEQFWGALHRDCTASIRLRDLSLARSTARQILDSASQIPSSHAYLRLYAATVLACDGSLRSEDITRLLQGRNRKAAARIHLLAGWAALKADNIKQTIESVTAFEQTGVGFPTGEAWKHIVATLNECVGEWPVVAQLGAPSLACGYLRQRMRENRCPVNFFHAFALANMSLAERKRSQGLFEAAGNSLRKSLGGWAALIENETAINDFIRGRLRCYGPKIKPTEPKMVIRRLEDFIVAAIERYPASDELKAQWRLERYAVLKVRERGGLRLPDHSRVDAGPILCDSLGLHQAIRGLADEQIRLLFSPLGTVVSLLEQRLFTAANRELNRIGSSLEQLGSRREDFQRLLVNSHLEAARDLIAQIPTDLNLLRKNWQQALEAAQIIGAEAQTRKFIAEMALARAEVLFQRRSRRQHLSDPDQRTLLVRRREATELEALAWELTRADLVKNVLTDHLDREAALLFNKGSLDACAERLFLALTVNPHAPAIAMNLALVLRSSRRSKLERGLVQDAGASLLEGMSRLRTLDPKAEIKEIQNALDQLEDLGPVPFVEYSAKALKDGDWKLATDLMIWALRISSGSSFVRDEAYILQRELSLCIEHGKQEVADCLRQLGELMPEQLPEID